MSTAKHYYIETFGCQMNDRDSEIMGQLLHDAAFLETTVIEDADIIVVNTCSVREKAEQKAYSLLGRLKFLKKKNPDLVIAVAGCVAQQDGKRLLKRIPHADLVIGPQKLYELPVLVKKHFERDQLQNGAHVQTGLTPNFVIPPFLPDIEKGSQFKRFVTIMQGCNNFCTYCVVPFTRGREVSRKDTDIIKEVAHLAASGIKEITLLGQNVNSYGQETRDSNLPSEDCALPSFAELLRAVAAVEGIERVRFTTSHPKDLSLELMRCFAELPTLCPHFHLPVQSGSNHILKRMNRKYSAEDYLEKVSMLRTIRPDIALTTDLIVGFPGETDEDFEATMTLLEQVRYHSAFSFKYSDRPPAKSVDFSDKVDEKIKTERLARLQKRQEEITLDWNQKNVGVTMEVMVEGDGKVDGQWKGRAPTNQIVNFPGPDTLFPGQTVSVAIEEACLHSLRGKLVIGS